uniref:Uncharacterized protein n=1 Tax=Peronospora matthiolae TaxID=2874970 RepID=A0AAV1TXF7_9STRA
MEDEKSVKYPWFFPVGAKMDGEKMRDAANRHVHETVGDEMRTAPMGFGPMGVRQVPARGEGGGGWHESVFFLQVAASGVARSR